METLYTNINEIENDSSDFLTPDSDYVLENLSILDEANDDISVSKKMVYRIKIINNLKMYKKLHLDALRYKEKILKLEDLKSKTDDSAKKSAISKKIETLSDFIKQDPKNIGPIFQRLSDIRKRMDELAKASGLGNFLSKRKYIVDTDILENKEKIIDNPEEKKKIQDTLKDRKEKTAEIIDDLKNSEKKEVEKKEEAKDKKESAEELLTKEIEDITQKIHDIEKEISTDVRNLDRVTSDKQKYAIEDAISSNKEMIKELKEKLKEKKEKYNDLTK